MTPYYKDIMDAVASYGGFFDAHLHLDRAGTYHRVVDLLSGKGMGDGTSLPLSGKHATIPLVHGSECYDDQPLHDRVAVYLEEMISVGTCRADTVVDTTLDRVGLSALETFTKLKSEYADRLDLRIGAYSPMGFRDDEPDRWTLFEEGAHLADFVGLLPERDGTGLYPEHIGYEECCRRGLALAHRLGKQIHVHVDQENHIYDDGSEIVLRLSREMNLKADQGSEPFIWLIHVISPSAYDEARFTALATGLAEQNIGIVCCPAAAISMRQIRQFQSPTHNSIARVLEFISAGVHMRIGSDNICDITSPFGTANLMDEVRVIGDALRYYDVDFLAGIAAGKRIDAQGIARLNTHLETDAKFASEIVDRHQNI